MDDGQPADFESGISEIGWGIPALTAEILSRIFMPSQRSRGEKMAERRPHFSHTARRKIMGYIEVCQEALEALEDHDARHIKGLKKIPSEEGREKQLHLRGEFQMSLERLLDFAREEYGDWKPSPLAVDITCDLIARAKAVQERQIGLEYSVEQIAAYNFLVGYLEAVKAFLANMGPMGILGLESEYKKVIRPEGGE